MAPEGAQEGLDRGLDGGANLALAGFLFEAQQLALITVPLFKDQKILTQVSGHGSHTIKLLPSLTITEDDCKWIETAFDSVIASSHKVPGAIWSLGKTLVDNAVRRSA